MHGLKVSPANHNWHNWHKSWKSTSRRSILNNCNADFKVTCDLDFWPEVTHLGFTNSCSWVLHITKVWCNSNGAIWSFAILPYFGVITLFLPFQVINMTIWQGIVPQWHSAQELCHILATMWVTVSHPLGGGVITLMVIKSYLITFYL